MVQIVVTFMVVVKDSIIFGIGFILFRNKKNLTIIITIINVVDFLIMEIGKYCDSYSQIYVIIWKNINLMDSDLMV